MKELLNGVQPKVRTDVYIKAGADVGVKQRVRWAYLRCVPCFLFALWPFVCDGGERVLSR